MKRVTVRRAGASGAVPGEHEHSWRVGQPDPGETLRVVLAAGLPESILPGRWARLLTSVFTKAPPSVTMEAESFARAGAEAAGQWPGELDDYASGREAAADSLRWYERTGLERGAYAAVLVLDVEPGGGWHGAAVGDACLFHVGEGGLENAFPLAAAKTSPLLGSPDTDPETVAPLVSLARGTAVPGDRLYACTGALAAWFLARHERGGRPWEVLDGLTQAFFEIWLEDLREKSQIRADEVTLIRVEITSGTARRACA